MLCDLVEAGKVGSMQCCCIVYAYVIVCVSSSAGGMLPVLA